MAALALSQNLLRELFKYLPNWVVAALFMSIYEEFGAITRWPKFGRELKENLGVHTHVKLVYCQNLPLLLAEKSRSILNITELEKSINI